MSDTYEIKIKNGPVIQAVLTSVEKPVVTQTTGGNYHVYLSKVCTRDWTDHIPTSVCSIFVFGQCRGYFDPFFVSEDQPWLTFNSKKFPYNPDEMDWRKEYTKTKWEFKGINWVIKEEFKDANLGLPLACEREYPYEMDQADALAALESEFNNVAEIASCDNITSEDIEELVEPVIYQDVPKWACRFIEAYCHSGVSWSEANTCTIDRRWDVTPHSGVIYLNDEAIKRVEYYIKENNLGEEEANEYKKTYMDTLIEPILRYMSDYSVYDILDFIFNNKGELISDDEYTISGVFDSEIKDSYITGTKVEWEETRLPKPIVL